ncbi:hypothetical protein FOF52_09315 [Thermobifida alba]|uniref:Integral membrane protein n=1 Tax=Thermobifida alba TaxID=53522 RepID=A0ABY4L0B4_THEAE|nr:hypothetical protein [Thermobifida alba]UPT21133.1 hypothetical protein FOF52_09315 [Thermobifida alba]
MTPPPPDSPAPARATARTVSRTVGILFLTATFLCGFLLPAASLATLVQLGTCDGIVETVPGCLSSLRGLLSLVLPWAGWLLGVFGALALFVVAWRRRRREWLWPLLGAAGYALSFPLALVSLFGLDTVLA